ncbi:MAG: zinc-binding dehydrogenase [Ignavibacterium sp.]|jgi:propanol-preferring alcohol dehydrogenase|nr:zinc-binding dehydrogenase [Ignavibacterium sp.]
MKAVRFVGVIKPLKLQEIPIPEIRKRDILVKIKAAGICHSDAHYRAGISPVSFTPLTLGHEIAGIVEKTGEEVTNVKPGDRVCLHYLITCGDCYYCSTGNEQFCKQGKMIGHHTDGGYAEYIAVPSRNAIHLPDVIPFEQGATLMCASATAYHALLKSRIKPGDKVAIFGVGGLGQSAIQLAKAFGASMVFAIDIDEKKLKLAAQYGAVPINGKTTNPVEEIKNLNANKGVDVAIEMIGLIQTQKQALQSVGPMGRVVLVGLSNKNLSVNTYSEILGNEVELIGSNDHLLQELPKLIDFAAKKMLDTSQIVSRTIPLDEDAINDTLDALEKFDAGVRTVIVL